MKIARQKIVASVVLGMGLIMAIGCQSSNDRLCLAIQGKDAVAVKRILEAGGFDLEPPSDLHQVNKPLAYAAAYGNLEIVKLLVESGADLNGQVAYGDVPLIKADEHQNDAIVEYLIIAGADVNVPNAFGITPFIGLCGRGDLKLVRIAAQKGGDINASFESKMRDDAGSDNFSPLQAAVYYGRKEVVDFLLFQGADSTAKDSKGKTLLDIAEAENHRAIVQLLKEWEK